MIQSEIIRIAGRGDGLTADGRYIPLTAPGDAVRDDGSIEPGPHHVVPPCRHYPECGGCQLQHVDDAAYAAFLTHRIVAALHSQGLDAPEMRTPYLSPPQSRRRVGLRAERKGKRLLIGFSEEKSHRIVDMHQCEIMVPELFALVGPLRSLLVELVADKRAASVQMTLIDQGVDLLIEKVAADGLRAAELLTSFAQEHGLARLSIDQGYGAEARWEPEPVTITLGGVPVPFPVGGFLQATADGEAALVAGVHEAIGDAGTVADLFAGLGTFALSLAGRVLAAEGARDAVLALKAAAGRAQRPIFVDHRECTLIRCALANFAPSSLDFELLFDVRAVEPADPFQIRSDIYLAILKRFADENIQFAYPTQTTFTAAPDGTMVMPWPSPREDRPA